LVCSLWFLFAGEYLIADQFDCKQSGSDTNGE
jgi:hypothetical protein